MTYYVSNGTLNPTHSLTLLLFCLFLYLKLCKNHRDVAFTHTILMAILQLNWNCVVVLI